MFTFHFRLSSKIASEEEKVNRVMTRGEIYIETENGLFPSIEWGDGILSTVNMWIGNTIRIVDSSNGEQNVTNYFMDGPYSFDIQKIGGNHIIIRFMQHVDKEEKEEMPSLTIALIDYYHALLELAENIIIDPNFQWYGKERERTNFKKGVFILKALL